MKNDLEQNLRALVDAKLINLDVSLGAIVNSGALSGVDPWDFWCGNGWIVRRRWPGPIPRFSEVESVRDIVRERSRTRRCESGPSVMRGSGVHFDVAAEDGGERVPPLRRREACSRGRHRPEPASLETSHHLQRASTKRFRQRNRAGEIPRPIPGVAPYVRATWVTAWRSCPGGAAGWAHRARDRNSPNRGCWRRPRARWDGLGRERSP